MAKYSTRSLMRASLGFEDFEDKEVVVADPSETIVGLDPEDNVAETVLDVNDGVSDIEDNEDVLNILGEAATTLEAIAITIEESLQNADVSAKEEEGLSDDAVAMAAVAIGEVDDKIGIDTDDISDPMATAKFYEPSVESFQGGKRRQASLETLEDVKNRIKAVWNAIKKAIVTFANMVANFFVGLVSKSAMLARKAKQIEAAASDMGKGKGEFSFKGAGKLEMGGRFEGAATVIEAVNAVESYSGNISKYVGDVEKMFEGLNHKDSFTDSGIKANPIRQLIAGKLPNGYHAEQSEAKGDEGYVAILKLQPQFVKTESKVSGDAKYAPATQSEVEEIARDVRQLVTKAIAVRKAESDRLKKVANDFVAKAGEAIKNEKFIEAAKDRVALTIHMRLGGKPWAKPVVQYAQIAFVTCSAALNFCEASIRASRKEVDAPAAA